MSNVLSHCLFFCVATEYKQFRNECKPFCDVVFFHRHFYSPEENGVWGSYVITDEQEYKSMRQQPTAEVSFPSLAEDKSDQNYKHWVVVSDIFVSREIMGNRTSDANLKELLLHRWKFREKNLTLISALRWTWSHQLLSSSIVLNTFHCSYFYPCICYFQWFRHRLFNLLFLVVFGH